MHYAHRILLLLSLQKVTDVGYEIRCDGKASNFRDIQLPWDICEYDPESRCRLLGEEACKEPALNKSILESLPKKGDDNAKITIIEFGDFTTEYSFKFFNETLLRLENEFINKGAVQFFWVGLPYEDTYNPGDKRAIEVAEAAKCAQEQGKFWEMHDKLFINQQNLTFENYNFENYQKWAQEIGLNEKEFNLCLDDRKYKKAVELEKSIAESMSLGTPTFYVNYKQLIGFQTFEEFEKEINKQLEDYY